MSMSKYFTSKKISERLTRIITSCGVCMYLVEGGEQAALLDTGFGYGDLKSYIRTLTDKPLLVLLTHGHLDHAGGSVQFDDVYLNQKDWELEKEHCNRERRIDEMTNGPAGMPEGVTAEDFLPARTKPYHHIDEGDDFDLGGVTIKTIAVPGHTQGTLVFLIPEERAVVFGDACGENTLLLLEESVTITNYEHNLLKLQEYEEEYDIILRNHGHYISPKELLANNIELCELIINRQDAKEPVSFMGIEGMIGRASDNRQKVGNILYNPNKIM